MLVPSSLNPSANLQNSDKKVTLKKPGLVPSKEDQKIARRANDAFSHKSDATLGKAFVTLLGATFVTSGLIALRAGSPIGWAVGAAHTAAGLWTMHKGGSVGLVKQHLDDIAEFASNNVLVT